MKITKGTIIRTALLVLALINNGLALFGKSPLPLNNDELTNMISFLFSAGTTLLAWWKNNSFTKIALETDRILKIKKKNKIIQTAKAKRKQKRSGGN